MITQTIVVVDDDKAVGLATRELLRSAGYPAVVFTSAEEFLRSEILHHTACLITDVKMPGMTGLELQAHLVRAGFRFPVILMTSFPDEDVRAQVMAAGAHSYVKKPLQVQAFMDCLEAAVQPA
jgi:FixJ family two-component response regulator